VVVAAVTLDEDAEVLQKVLDERVRQVLRWGQQNHRPERFLVILLEEVGEVARAFNDNEPRANVVAETVQVAAVALAFAAAMVRNYDVEGYWNADQRQ